jgi:hypothetical protein
VRILSAVFNHPAPPSPRGCRGRLSCVAFPTLCPSVRQYSQLLLHMHTDPHQPAAPAACRKAVPAGNTTGCSGDAHGWLSPAWAQSGTTRHSTPQHGTAYISNISFRAGHMQFQRQQLSAAGKANPVPCYGGPKLQQAPETFPACETDCVHCRRCLSPSNCCSCATNDCRQQ